ncbi:helix-turn-helix transcriptional regulator [Curtobacterium sp. MCSS17_015]|uniref:AraC family transcriptional regulator n=1 Tax=Curtobacterium sp. MCSS17_015 TaxID=2175666 RepID=UPI0011B547C7|nr:helix-turn-helix transcriptional regulator [Curtobacterium sp. MCSS17_015]WIB25176.1 helix-turn-helix transcriptional regulator [Curtobacterium sp. MCSS17_015]
MSSPMPPPHRDPHGGPEHPPVRRDDVAGRDLDEAMGFYERVHNAHQVRLTQDESRPFGFRFRAVGDDRLRLRSSALSARRWGRIEPEGRYLVTWAHDGQVAFDAGTDDELVAEAGVPAVYPTGRPFTIEAPAGVTLHTIDVDARALEDLHAARTGTSPGPLVFARRPDAASLAALRAVLAASTPVLLDPAADRLERARHVDAVSRRMLDAFAPVPAAPRHVGHPRNVARALDYIEEHLGEPVTAADIAQAAGLSQRGLQQAFGRNDLPTPLETLREARLRRVRTALADARPGEVSVAAVAREYGFAHLGRFAGYYAERFGERPSDTLRS